MDLEEGVIDNNNKGESKDLSDWQEKHAVLVLSKVKELSQLRFRLCPRYLKEQQFWRIYFTLVKNHVANVNLVDLEEGVVDNNNKGESKDLSDWQEKHAVLVLSKVKELSQLRFRLCPRYLKEQQFWRIYFTLVKNHVAKYELHAIRLEKLKQMAIENKKDMNNSGYEVEMLEARKPTNMEPETSLE
ncbi:BSD domain-containing protein [Artemisia annua]|uniref:BSD domain-containing protein n=1 Tax=Artemisia annua TaxID=35608 RepID=A0A2U1PBJ6_ARTAN|nr:BSD domain-containing protein [Artemisia annua]